MGHWFESSWTCHLSEPRILVGITGFFHVMEAFLSQRKNPGKMTVPVRKWCKSRAGERRNGFLPPAWPAVILLLEEMAVPVLDQCCALGRARLLLYKARDIQSVEWKGIRRLKKSFSSVDGECRISQYLFLKTAFRGRKNWDCRHA